MNGLERLAMIRKRCRLTDETEVGMWSTFGHNTTVKTHPSGGRQIELIATTGDMDEDEESVRPEGAQLDYWAANGFKMYGDHAYSLFDVAGVVKENSLKIFPDLRNPKGWKMVAGLMKNPVGDAVAALAEETGQIGVSIGFSPVEVERPTTKDGPTRIIKLWKWLETSFTAMPCNVACQGTLVSAPEKMLDELDRLVVKGRIPREAARMLGLPDGKAATPPEPLTLPKRKRTVVWVEKQ